MISFRAHRLRDLMLPGSVAWLMADIAETKGKQDLYTARSPRVLKTLREAALVQSAESSNRIEGITVDPKRLAPLVLQNVKPQDRSEQEVQNYRKALDLIHSRASELAIEPQTLVQLHEIIQHGVADAGQWKQKNNDIIEYPANGSAPFVRFSPVSAAQTPEAIDELCRSYATGLQERWTNPLILDAAVVFDFLCIHPFRDGNGRLARLLTLLVLYQHGYEVGRYVSLERIVEESKTEYYDALYKSSVGWHEGRHDLIPWIIYWLTIVRRAYHEFEQRVGQIGSPRGSKEAMVRAAIEAQLGEWTVGDIERACPGISHATIRRAIVALQKSGEIAGIGRGPGAKWRKKSAH